MDIAFRVLLGRVIQRVASFSGNQGRSPQITTPARGRGSIVSISRGFDVARMYAVAAKHPVLVRNLPRLSSRVTPGGRSQALSNLPRRDRTPGRCSRV